MKNWYKISKIEKLAQEANFIERMEVEGIIEGFGSRRFVIGFRKKDGSLRMMNAQRRVQRPYGNNNDGYAEDRAYLTLYDLQVASQIARESLENVDVNDFDPSALRKAYRRVYPHSVEFIKGDGQTHVVRHSEIGRAHV